MPTIELKYGSEKIPFNYDAGQFDVLGGGSAAPPLTDIEIGERLEDPIGSPTLSELVQPGRSVLFVVPDATRQAAAGQIVNLVTRRLIADGVMPFDISIIFATGIHRPVTLAEKEEILTPFIAQRVKTLDHSPRDLMQIVRVGETSGSIPIELNRALMQYDHVITIGSVAYHYFAGFTGGRKLLTPGLAGSRTIAATHKLAFDCETKDRREGVGTGLMDGNPVHEAFEECAAKIENVFAINTLLSEEGNLNGLYCGDRRASHRAACDTYDAEHNVELREKRDLVIVDAGGSPHDINLIQAQKSLDAAASACKPGGTIIFLAACPDGLGRSDFMKWFEFGNSSSLAERLCDGYEVNGQTAWTLLKKAESFDIQIACSLAEDDVAKMGMRKIDDLKRTLEQSDGAGTGYIIPSASKYRFTLT
ncbi:MAG: nickel-dependent lactate racemase [Blastocatellia bacterium]|nr:nickel-dependent lactate racemase [Blastocatellia bacterium]